MGTRPYRALHFPRVGATLENLVHLFVLWLFSHYSSVDSVKDAAVSLDIIGTYGSTCMKYSSVFKFKKQMRFALALFDVSLVF